MMDIEQLLTHIVRPTLKKIGMHSVAAERLVMGTIAQESRATYVKQLGNGPAMGLAQMEPATHDDIWEHYLKYKPEMAAMISHLASVGSLNEWHQPDANELIGNVVYAVAMCRVHYRRFPDALPDADDLPGMAAYWKRYYNTVKGAGTEEEFLEKFPRVILQKQLRSGGRLSYHYKELFMKYLFMVAFLMIAPAALASPELPAFDWMALLVMLGGEHGKVIAGWIAVGLVIWSQVRQLIPPSWLAKLPGWLITIIEWLAANKGTASNDLVNDPRHIKRVKP